jgi:hypothetical protein
MYSTTLRTALLILLCLPLLGLDDAPTSSVEILPHWKKGERFSINISRVREKSVDGKSTTMGKTRTPFTIEVLDASTEGYLIGWTPGATSFEAPAPAPESFLRQVSDLMKGAQIILQVNPKGTITGIQNWKEIKLSAHTAMEKLFATSRDSPNGKINTVLLAKLQAQWNSMFVTKEQIEQLCTREAQLYFKVLGRTYSRTTPSEYDVLLPNPLGGADFPAYARMTLSVFDRQSGQAVITWNQTADPQQAIRILESTITEMNARRGQKGSEPELPQSIALQDKTTIVVDMATGWVQTLTQARSLNLGKRIQVDTISIVRTAK